MWLSFLLVGWGAAMGFVVTHEAMRRERDQWRAMTHSLLKVANEMKDREVRYRLEQLAQSQKKPADSVEVTWLPGRKVKNRLEM